MAIPKSQRYEHAEIRVKDLERALEFYTEIMGMVEIAREGDVVYLGCGYDENYDLAVRPGGTGVVHFALRARSEEELEMYARRLKEDGIQVTRTDGNEPNQERGIRFAIPSGHEMELVLVKDNRYLELNHPAYPRTKGFCPIDADHINLVANNVRDAYMFMERNLDCKASDVTQPDPSNPDFWAAAWFRFGDYHHDVAFFLTDQHTTNRLHHVAFAMSGIDHMKRALDMMANYGLRVEAGPGRHPIGANLFIYFWDPGGNRIELSAEGSILNPRTPTRYWRGLQDTLDAWGNLHERLPETFMQSS